LTPLFGLANPGVGFRAFSFGLFPDECYNLDAGFGSGFLGSESRFEFGLRLISREPRVRGAVEFLLDLSGPLLGKGSRLDLCSLADFGLSFHSPPVSLFPGLRGGLGFDYGPLGLNPRLLGFVSRRIQAIVIFLFKPLGYLGQHSCSPTYEPSFSEVG